MLDRYLLRYFLAVVDQGNFSRAAAHCHVSQPTLSVGIAKLERTLGSPLFVRSNQRVQLTPAGSHFLQHARRIEREFNLALQSMSMGSVLPPLRLGILTSISGDVIARSVSQSRPQDDFRFELIFGSERELISHLSKGRVDICLTLVDRGSGRFCERPFLSEGYNLAIATAHSLAEKTEIAAEQLADETMIVRRHCEALAETSRFFTERGVRPHFALRSTNDDRVMQMVAAGLGITIIPSSHHLEGVMRPLLSGFGLRRTLGWMTTADNEALLADPPAILTAIEAALDLATKNRPQ